MGTWETAKASAMKVLGEKGKIPEPKTLDKAGEGLDKAFEAFSKSRDDLEEKLVGLQDADSAVSHAFDQFGTLVEKSDLGLDLKNKDDAKKITQAKKILTDYVTTVTKAQEANNKNLKELDKHMILLSKYKPPKT
jgi:prefoldin subunit 5